MSTEPTLVLIPHIDFPNDPSTLELLTEQQEHYFGRTDTYQPLERLEGLCGSYKAKNHAEEPVFLKAFDNTEVDQPLLRDMYARELRAAQDMAPLGIMLPIKDTGREHVFIVQEFIPGRTLSDYITIGGAVEADHARKIITPIANTMKLTHSKGYIHRDLKPDNIMYRAGDFKLEHPIILDWGFACRESELQMIDHCVGTPKYAAPEQFKPYGIADERSDIYSLGILLYKLLTGTYPYKEESKGSDFVRQKEYAHNPLLKNNFADARLSLITLKMTQPAKSDRHQTIDELLEDLNMTRMVAAR